MWETQTPGHDSQSETKVSHISHNFKLFTEEIKVHVFPSLAASRLDKNSWLFYKSADIMLKCME